jgi:hypothetical protein
MRQWRTNIHHESLVAAEVLDKQDS